MRDTKKAIGIIGFGNMGSSIAERIKSKYKVWVFDKDKNKTKGLRDINIADNSIDLVDKVETVILAVKPQDFDNVLNEIKDHVREKLVISIAAGINTGYIEKRLQRARVIRVMPNLPARIGKGTIYLCRGRSAVYKDLNLALNLFKNLGTTFIIGEEMMDAVTAVSGSGPGYFCDYMESKSLDYRNITEDEIEDFIYSLTEAAETLGFPKKQAKETAESTVRGTLATLQAEDMIASKLKKQIVSKGGTTEAALEVLHRGGTLVEAVKAAVKRAKELSKRSR